ncbi:MAG: polynucleotide adenylyltransferase PcnB [Gammaproteobacteria bacterium]
MQPVRIERAEHPVSRARISKNALTVLYGLKKAGYEACLVGGGVRDLLVDLQPKDFDIATNALPEEVRNVFRNCRLIGRRFRLAHVHFGREIIEVATYRAAHDKAASPDQASIRDDQILRDNVFGNRDEDALRRDFSINALYYDIADFAIIDYFGGFEDVEKRQLRMIGDPEQRYREDPVRLLRAVRLAAKLSFSIETATARPITRLGDLLDNVPRARLFEELLKLFQSGHAVKSYEMLQQYDLMQHLLLWPEQIDPVDQKLVELALLDSDQRLANGKTIAPFFTLAALLWPIRQAIVRQEFDNHDDIHALHGLASHRAIADQNHLLAIPKRIAQPIQEVWNLQDRFLRRIGKKPGKLLHHPRFRGAYDFLLLRARAEPESDQNLPELAQWWTDFQHTDTSQRNSMTQPDKSRNRPRRRRARRPAKKSS